jgi:hypothetical protein
MSVGAIVCAAAALLAALAAAGGAWTGRDKLYQGAINGAWAGLAMAMGAIWAEQATGGAAALAVAALAAVAALPTAGAAVARHQAARTGVAPALTLGLAAVIWAANTTLEPLPGAEAPLLLAGQWGALGAGLTLAWSAAGQGAVWAALGLLGGAALWGNTRAGAPDQGFAMALSTQGGPVYYGLPIELGGANVLGIPVAVQVPQLNGLLAALALMALASLVVRPQRHRLWLLISAGAMVGAGLVLWTGMHPALPDAEAYKAWASALAAERKLPDQAIARLGLQHTGQVFVRWVEVLPTLSALVALALTGIGLSRPAQAAPSSALLARDWLVRAVALIGLSVASGMFVAWRQLGAWGTGAPGEWIALGLALVGVGGLMTVWRAGDTARRHFTGVWVALCVAAILAALAFGAPFAVSVRL